MADLLGVEARQLRNWLRRDRVTDNRLIERLVYLERMRRDVPALWVGVVEFFRYTEDEARQLKVYEDALYEYMKWAGSSAAALGEAAPTIPPYPRLFRLFDYLD